MVVLTPGTPDSFLQCHVDGGDHLFTPWPPLSASSTRKVFRGSSHTCPWASAFQTPSDEHTGHSPGHSRLYRVRDAGEAGGGKSRCTGPGICLPKRVLGDSHMFNTAPFGQGSRWGGAGQGQFPGEGVLTEFWREKSAGANERGGRTV